MSYRGLLSCGSVALPALNILTFLGLDSQFSESLTLCTLEETGSSLPRSAKLFCIKRGSLRGERESAVTEVPQLFSRNYIQTKRGKTSSVGGSRFVLEGCSMAVLHLA